MAKDAEKDIQAMTAEEDEFDDVIVFTDDEGQEHEFYEEIQFTVGNKTYAVLIALSDDGCSCGDEVCHCSGGRDSETAFIAKVEFDADDGTPIYVETTDEEYEEALQIYNSVTSDQED